MGQATEFLLVLVLATCLCAAGWLLLGARRRPAHPTTSFAGSTPRVAVPGPETDRLPGHRAAGAAPGGGATPPAAAGAVRQQRQNTSAAGRITRLGGQRSQPAGVPVGHR